MSSLKQDLIELLSLTQLYLLREYPLQKNQTVHPATLAFFQKTMTFPMIPSTSPSIPSPPNTIKKMASPPIPPATPPVKITAPVTQKPPSPSVQLQPISTPQLIPSSSEPPIHPLPPLARESTAEVIQNKTSQEEKERIQSKRIRLEPLPASPPSHDDREFWKLFKDYFPEVILSTSIPNDANAQKLKNHWKTKQEIFSVLLLSFDYEEKQLLFLKNIAKAISLQFAPARVLSVSQLEKEQAWETLFNSSHLRLIIASDYDLYLHPSLMRYYREAPQQGKHFIRQIPLLLLSDLSLYLKETQLKALLWRAICNELTSPPQHPSIL